MDLLRNYLRTIRIKQWTKNLLLFVPLFLAHGFNNPEKVRLATYAFLAFSLCASGIYILNDLHDLEMDKNHPLKKRRPFASGQLPVSVGYLIFPFMLLASLWISEFYLPPHFVRYLALYAVFAVLYSLYLKRLLVIDVLVLAGLYTLRLVAGGIATGVPLSPWLQAFSLFFFTSLAFMKRYSELKITQQNAAIPFQGRGYTPADRELLASFGPTCGYLSVVVFTLYLNSKEVIVLYQNPTVLLLIGPCLLYWISRIWFLAHRGSIEDDPIAFALKDPVSYAVGAVVIVIMLVATGLPS